MSTLGQSKLEIFRMEIQAETPLFKIVGIGGWDFGLVHLKEFDEDFIRGGNHGVLPESQIGNILLENNALGFQVLNNLINIIGLNSKMMDISSNRVLRWLVVEMHPASADSDKYVSLSSQYGVEDNAAPKEFFVKLHAFINVRSKDMNVMNVTNHS